MNDLLIIDPFVENYLSLTSNLLYKSYFINKCSTQLKQISKGPLKSGSKIRMIAADAAMQRFL
jgi:hypothetical protein